jgi:hypothetical protein
MGIEHSLDELVHSCTLLAVRGVTLKGHLDNSRAEATCLLVGGDAVIREDGHLAWNCLDRTWKYGHGSWRGGIGALSLLSTAIIQPGYRFNFSF